MCTKKVKRECRALGDSKQQKFDLGYAAMLGDRSNTPVVKYKDPHTHKGES